MSFRDYYEKTIEKLTVDIEHIKRHMESESDPDEAQRLKELRGRLIDEKLNYMGALEDIKQSNS